MGDNDAKISSDHNLQLMDRPLKTPAKATSVSGFTLVELLVVITILAIL